MSTILITGASSGLGAEMARQFGAKGYDLALCARRTDRLEDLRDEILTAQPGQRVELRALDVNDDAQVFDVFRGFRDDFGRLDRVIVNAGLGKGAPLGTGHYDANRETAMTNFVAALCQAEAAMEIFRQQDAGHLVLVSSMSAMRGMPKSMTVYAATKAALSHLGEGLQYELLGKPIKVTVLHCGYIASEMNEKVQQQVKFMVSTQDGVRSMVDAIEKQKAHAYVPALPWTALAPVMKHAPLPLLKRLL
jgi:short-subunit dehydrogenase